MCKVAEFFAGIGLMRLGLEAAGCEVSYANDISRDKMEMYLAHFGDDGHFHLGDIHDIDPASIPAVDIATASFPCTDLSLAGSRAGLAGKESSAFWGFIDILSKMRKRPGLVLLENVPGFLTSHGGKDFAEAMQSLADLGYFIDPLIIDAVHFLPQSRQRLFVVCSLKKPKGSTSFCQFSATRPKTICETAFHLPGMPWAFSSMPSLPTPFKTLKDILEDIPAKSPLWWSPERTDYLLNQMSDKHRRIIDEMITGNRYSYGTVFRRVRNGKSMAELRTDGIAGCLRTPKGGSGRQILVMAGRGKFAARLLTGRECARLMGADDFVISDNLNKALFGFGDAVAVPVVTWLVENHPAFNIIGKRDSLAKVG